MEYSPNKTERLTTVARISGEDTIQRDVKSGTKDTLQVVQGVLLVYNLKLSALKNRKPVVQAGTRMEEERECIG